MNRKLAIVAIACACLVVGCGKPPDPTTPKGAFAMVGQCIDKVSRQCFFRRLERETRWSVCTIHRTLKEMRKVVERAYPEPRRKIAYGAWAEEATAETPEALFEMFCEKQRCLEKVARGYGAVRKVSEKGEDMALLETTRGATFKMRRVAGKWGLDLYREELNAVKLRMLDRLKQVKKNAAQYDEQRLANQSQGRKGN
jgi:hypothetical protein